MNTEESEDNDANTLDELSSIMVIRCEKKKEKQKGKKKNGKKKKEEERKVKKKRK